MAQWVPVMSDWTIVVLLRIASILAVVSLALTAVAMALGVYSLGAGRDLLAIYWATVVIVALRFGLQFPEPD